MGESKLYVGNLSYDTTENNITGYFEEKGGIIVEHVNMIMDRATGRPKGFAFVTVRAQEGDQKDPVTTAVDNLHDTELDGRTIRVSRANPPGEGGGGRGRGYQGGRGGGYSGGGGGYGGGGYSGGGGGGYSGGGGGYRGGQGGGWGGHGGGGGGYEQQYSGGQQYGGYQQY